MNHLPRAVRNDALNQTGLVILALLEARPGMTLRRLARACGIVTKRAHDHVRRLRRLGLVAFEDGRLHRPAAVQVRARGGAGR